MKTKLLQLFAITIVLSTMGILTSNAQTPGTLDVSFGNNGITLTDYTQNGNDNYSFASALQPDGKIVLGGYSSVGNAQNITFVRYNSNGTIDNTFSSNGIVVLPFGGSNEHLMDIVVQPDGKIVFVGYTDNGTKTQMIAGRLNTDGSLDNSFNANGMLVINFGSSTDSYGLSVALMDDGKIIIGGYIMEDQSTVFNAAMCMLNSSGFPDNSFGVNGIVTHDILSQWNFMSNIAIYNNKIILGGMSVRGSDFARFVTFTRYELDGTLDTGFGTSGVSSVELDEISIAGYSINGMRITEGGKIVFACGIKTAWLHWDLAVLRYHESGLPDNSFGTNGMVITTMEGSSNLSDAVVQADGKIIAAGYHKSPDPGSYDFLLVRYLENGDLDETFGIDGTGVVISNVSPEIWYGDKCFSLILLDDGKLIASGYAKTDHVNPDFAVARYHTGYFVEIDKPVYDELKFSIAPNPFTNKTKLTFKVSELTKVKVEVFNSSGIKVASPISEVFQPGEQQFDWDANNLAPGIYLLKILIGNKVYSEKVVKME